MNDMKDLQNAIMNRVLTIQQDKKARKRKEKTVMFIYVGAIFFALLFLYLEWPQHVSPKLRLPGLAEFESGKEYLIVYYKIFTITLVFSLIAFGAYFVKSRRSHNRG